MLVVVVLNVVSLLLIVIRQVIDGGTCSPTALFLNVSAPSSCFPERRPGIFAKLYLPLTAAHLDYFTAILNDAFWDLFSPREGFPIKHAIVSVVFGDGINDSWREKLYLLVSMNMLSL